VSIGIHFAGWDRCTGNLIGIWTQFTPFGNGQTNVLALKEFQCTIAQDNGSSRSSTTTTTTTIRARLLLGNNVLEHVNLFITCPQRDGPRFIAYFHFGQAYA
jgi:hypothetical protein